MFPISPIPNQETTCPDAGILGRHSFMMEQLDEVGSAGFNISKAQIIGSLNNHEAFIEWDFYEYDDGQFDGLFIKENKFCSVSINIFKARKEEKYVCDVTHTDGDVHLFKQFYRLFKFSITAIAEPEARTAFVVPPSSFLSLISVETFIDGMRPVFKMAQSWAVEKTVEAAKILIMDAKNNSSHLLNETIMVDVIDALETLLNCEATLIDPLLKPFAVMACAMFSNIPGYKESILASSLMDTLYQIVMDSPTYQTAKMRRVSAGVIQQLLSDDIIELFLSKQLIQEAMLPYPVSCWRDREIYQEPSNENVSTVDAVLCDFCKCRTLGDIVVLMNSRLAGAEFLLVHGKKIHRDALKEFFIRKLMSDLTIVDLTYYFLLGATLTPDALCKELRSEKTFEPFIEIDENVLNKLVHCLERQKDPMALIICGLLLEGRIINYMNKPDDVARYIEKRIHDAIYFYMKAGLSNVMRATTDLLLWQNTSMGVFPSIRKKLAEMHFIPWKGDVINRSLPRDCFFFSQQDTTLEATSDNQLTVFRTA